MSLSLWLKDTGLFYKGFSPPLRCLVDSNLLLLTNRKLPSWKTAQPLSRSASAELHISCPHTISRRARRVSAICFLRIRTSNCEKAKSYFQSLATWKSRSSRHHVCFGRTGEGGRCQSIQAVSPRGSSSPL